MDYFDYLFVFIVGGLALFLLVGFTFHFAYGLGHAMGEITERLRMTLLVGRVEACAALGSDEADEEIRQEELP